MRRLLIPVLSMVLAAAAASSALAQADAQQAFQGAKAAYAAEKFTEARDLARQASQTDPRNPEVFLLLGKAHYQLGELDEAIAAWQQTLKLAPEEPYAAKMLAVLRGEAADIDTRLALIEAFIAARLFDPAVRQCQDVLRDEALSDAQRVKVWTFQIEVALAQNRPADALRLIEILRVRQPDEADPVQTDLFEGQGKLRIGGESAVEGLAMLRKLVADHPDTPAAATAQLEILKHQLRQGVDPTRAAALAEWLKQSPDHPLVADALKALLDAYLAVTLQGPKPKPDDGLTQWDVDALAVAKTLYDRSVRADDAKKLTDQLLGHFEEHYAAAGAHRAAVQGAEGLLAASLPRDSRRPVLGALAKYKTALTIKYLDEQARTGKLPSAAARGVLPAPLAEVIKLLDTIDTEYPAQPAWAEQVALAAKVRSYAPLVPWSPTPGGLKSPDAWAFDVALPVIQAGADSAQVQAAVDLVQGIVDDYAGREGTADRRLAVELSTVLVGALPPEHGAYLPVLARHGELLADLARRLFDENVEAGNAAANAEVSEVQKQYVAVLVELVTCDVKQAPTALVKLKEHVLPWTVQGHWDVAEQLCTTLAEALPAAEKRQAELAVVDLWIEQVEREHVRLASIGLSVPRELDPVLKRALLRCYALQSGLDPEDPQLAEVRAFWEKIVAHYVALEYFDVAEAAIKLKPEKAEDAVPAANEFAAFQLVALAESQARAELARTLAKQYGAADKITAEGAFNEVVAGWTGFIADRQDSPLVEQAVERVFGIGRLFAQHQAHAEAAKIYGRLAEFGAGIKVLSQALPNRASTVERAAVAAADALDDEARKVLAKLTAERTGDEPPPEKLSQQYAAAVAAYKDFLAAHPKSPLAGGAIQRIMAVAMEYARIDAWDVAEGVYADLLASNLEIRRPERLKFARGLCQLGRAMPDHAREVLETLTAGGLRGTSGAADADFLAAVTLDDAAVVGWRWGDLSGTGEGTVGGDRVAAPDNGRPGTAPGGGMGAGSGAGPAAGAVEGAEPAEPPPAATAPADVPERPRRTPEAQRDLQLLAMIRQQEANRAAQVAQLREGQTFHYRYSSAANQPMQLAQQAEQAQGQQAAQQTIQQSDQQMPQVGPPVLSEAELKRQQEALDAAYAIFQMIRTEHPKTVTAEQARGEILVMVTHWRGLAEWERAAGLAGRFLEDNPTDRELPKLRLEIARDRLAWASKPIERKATKQEMLAEVTERFDAARAELGRVVADFPDERGFQQQAQWEIAGSWLKQARVVGAFSSTLAQGQYVRAARELRGVARRWPDHPQLGSIPGMLWNIAAELEGRGFYDEAIVVWNELRNYDPLDGHAQEAATKIAQTYHLQLKRPLKAAEAYQELNFARGGNDQALQNAIFQIGTELKGQERWVEALHVLETFVDSFPRHGQAGQALTMVGQIHQANEAWKDAIAAYRRVMAEFEDGQFVQEAKWAIAECTINLSQWREAMDAYREYVKAYPQDGKVEEANRRIEVLKDLVRYQGLVDEEGQRKAFDAQFQIARIVLEQLSNPVKATIEYRKVVDTWPDSHLADDALYAVGTTFLSRGETEKAREALLQVGARYPASPLADDALFMVGKSFEGEADKLASLTREQSLEEAQQIAQRKAYRMAQSGRRQQEEIRGEKIASLKAAGKGKAAEVEEAAKAAQYGQFSAANTMLFAQQAFQEVEALTAAQLADREDKINAALRKAVGAYDDAAKVAGADKADEALLQMATIYDQRLKDSKAAMQTWLEIVRQFSGTAVAEDASWRIAQVYERDGKYAEAIEAYSAFLRNYRRSPKAGQAQFAIAENHEHLGQWVNAMDAYTNYVNNFPDGPLVEKAKGQINWIKTYRL